MIGVIITAVYAYVLTTVILKSAMHFTTITTTKEEQEEGLTFSSLATNSIETNSNRKEEDSCNKAKRKFLQKLTFLAFWL